MKQSFLLNVIVPVFNEEVVLERFFFVLKKNISKFNYEIIFVDDGSNDSSLEILSEFCKTNAAVKVVKLKKNFGQQHAIYAGLCCAKGDCAVVMDADLQDSPKYVSQMIDQWQKRYKIVFAQRKSRSDNLLKKITAFLFYRIYRLIINNKAALDSGDFYLLDKKVIRNIIQAPNSRFFLRGAIAKENFPQTHIFIDRQARKFGKTKYSIKKMLILAYNAFRQTKLKADNIGKGDLIEEILYATKE